MQTLEAAVTAAQFFEADGNLRAAEFAQLVRVLAQHGGKVERAIGSAKAERVKAVLQKAATTPSLLTDVGWTDPTFGTLAAGFVESLRRIGTFDAMYPGMRKFDLRVGIAISSNSIAADRVAEGAPTPVTHLALTHLVPKERKVAAIVVASKELLKVAPLVAESLLSAELKASIVSGTDKDFLATIIAATTPTAASGTTAAAVLADLKSMLATMTINATSKLFLVVRPEAAASLAVMAGSSTEFAFPQMTPTGGAIAGMTVLVSDQLPSGTAVLADATAITAYSGTITIDASENVTIQLNDTPDNPSTAATLMQSMWQRDSTAIKADRWLAYDVLRSAGIRSLSGVAY
jgi:HK97 family phage major capsid protein